MFWDVFDSIALFQLVAAAVAVVIVIASVLLALHWRRRERILRAYALALEAQNTELRDLIARTMTDGDGWTMADLNQEFGGDGPGPDDTVH